MDTMMAKRELQKDPSQPRWTSSWLLFKQKKDYSYCFIFADYDSSALKVKKKLRRSFGEVESSELDPNDYNDGIDSMEQASKKFRDALSVTGTGMILLAVAWTSDQSSKKFRMFPEFMSCDTTKSTNSEERSLLLCSGKCSNNNTFTHTWMFLPSECAWVFSWAFGSAVPALHGTGPVEKVQVVALDQCNQENTAMSDLCGPGKVYKKAKVRNCAYHKIHRNYLDSKKSPLAELRKECPRSAAEHDVIKNMLWFLVKEAETEEESTLVVSMLEWFLDNVFLETLKASGNPKAAGLVSSFHDTKDWIMKNFCDTPSRPLFFACFFADMMHMGNTTSNASESENSSMKGTVDGPRPNDSLDVSFQKIGQVNTRRERRKDRKNQAQLEGLPTKIGDQERTVEGWTPFANKEVHKEHDERVNYVSYCVNNNKFLVKRDYKSTAWTGDELQPSFTDMTAQGISKSTWEWHRPKFERTRTVTLIFRGGGIGFGCS